MIDPVAAPGIAASITFPPSLPYFVPHFVRAAENLILCVRGRDPFPFAVPKVSLRVGSTALISSLYGKRVIQNKVTEDSKGLDDVFKHRSPVFRLTTLIKGGPPPAAARRRFRCLWREPIIRSILIPGSAGTTEGERLTDSLTHWGPSYNIFDSDSGSFQGPPLLIVE